MMSDSECSVALFHGPNQPLELRTIALPDLPPKAIRVRVRCCTVCGSDLHTFQGHRHGPTPAILGHEIIGDIAEFGKGAMQSDYRNQPLRKGDRVTWTIAASCGECFFCNSGLPQKCDRLFKYGHEPFDGPRPLSGGMTGFCDLVPGTSLLRLNDDLPDEVACPVNCATATVTAAVRMAGECTGKSVLIQGGGLLGLTLAAIARVQGASHIFATDANPDRRDLLLRFGATACFDAVTELDSLTAAIRDATDGRGADLGFEVCGAPAAAEEAMRLLRIGGRYLLVGTVFPTRPIALSPEWIIRRMLTIQGLHNYTPVDLATAVAFLEENHDRFPFAEVVQAAFPLTDADAAMHHAVQSKSLRVAIHPW